jgi:hypothetical protein
MATDERFDETISRWLEQTAPARLPERVLEATFERTRGSRQHVGIRGLLGRIRVTRSAFALGGAVVVVMAAALAFDFYADRPAVGVPVPTADPRSPFLGTWTSTSDADGGTQTMTIGATGDGAVEVVVTDDIATVCSGGPSTMTGTGRLEGSTVLVIPSPVYTCDDGSEPKALSGPPLQEQLRNLTYVHDPESDTLNIGPGSVWTRGLGEAPSPGPTMPSEAEVTELLNGFLEARVAGEGAEQYLDGPEEDIPLLYATTSGAPYERAEFEPVPGIEWPYGWMAFKVRLFAGDTVVEQLLFMGADGPPWLEYQPYGFATHIAPTTEDGQPVAMPYTYFDGEVTLRAAHPWVFHDGWAGGRLIPEGPGVRPTTDGGERIDWDELVLIADPVLLGTDCQTGPGPADAAALAESIRSDPDLGATAPVVVRVGGAEALMMDVAIAAGATVCAPTTRGGDLLQNAVLRPVLDMNGDFVPGNLVLTGHATGERMRLYLFDVPEGSSMRILAIAIIAPESRFERVVEAAAPILDSFEFRAP